MANLLPRIIALKSPHFNAYLSYNNDSDSEQYTFCIFNPQTSVFSSVARFEVVPSNTDTQVHIRSLHNGKFLRRKVIRANVIFSPEADEPVESNISLSGTRISPVLSLIDNPDRNPERMRLFHNGGFLYARIDPLMAGGKIFLGSEGPWSPTNDHRSDLFNVIDLESLRILPRHVALKGENGFYLQQTTNNQLRFMSDDKGHPDSWFEVSTDRDGVAEIKVFHSPSRYLRFNSINNRIEADPSPSGFRPVKIDASTVALISLSNNKFCTRHTSAVVESGLSALDTSHSMNRWSLFTLEELVVSRTVYNTVFHLQNAVIYGETPVAMSTVNASNNSSEPNKVNLNFTYTDFQSSTWGASHSWMVRAKVRVRVGIPFIKSATVTVEGEYSGSYEWEEAIETEKKFETTYTVTVPAHTSISVSLVATKGQCDVPYTYYQRDLLYNGRSAVYRKDDGMYTGINAYNFHYEVATLEEPDSKASVLYKSQILPHPTWIGPSKVQKIPLPTEKDLETTTELQGDDVASTAMKGKDSTAVSPMPEPVLEGDDVARTAKKGKDSTAVLPMPEPVLQGDDVASTAKKGKDSTAVSPMPEPVLQGDDVA